MIQGTPKATADNSIKSLFNSAQKKRHGLETALDSTSSTFKGNLAAAIASYEECRLLADRLSLFSPNETLEDISSGDLQYLLINYWLAGLLTRVADADRETVIENARTAYERYLSLLSHYDIFSIEEKKLYEQYIESPTTFSTIPTTDLIARRAAKIANFQHEKELKQKLEFLVRNPAYLEHDDDAIRELQLASIHLCTHDAFQALENINRELEILAAAPPAPPAGPEPHNRDYRERGGMHVGREYSDRLDGPLSSLSPKWGAGPLLDKGGKPLRPFTLLDNRQRLREGVFKPSHNLPTMTIDEYLEEERRRGGIIEGGGEASGIIPEPDEDNYEEADQETMKAREWDEFVEANPKGSGNTLNRG